MITPLFSNNSKMPLSANSEEILNPELRKDLDKEQKDLKIFGIYNSSIYSIAKKIAKIAFYTLGITAIVTTAIFMPTLGLPVAFGVGAIFLKLNPKINRFFETRIKTSKIRERIIENMIQKKAELSTASLSKLRSIAKSHNIKLKKGSPLLKKKNSQHLKNALARYLVWKDEIKTAESFQGDLKKLISAKKNSLIEHEAKRYITQGTKTTDGTFQVMNTSDIEEIKNDLDNHYNLLKSAKSEAEKNDLLKKIKTLEDRLPLSEEQVQNLVQTIISKTHELYDSNEEDSLETQRTAKLLSGVRAAFMHQLMENPSSTRSFEDFGDFNIQPKYTRELLSGSYLGDGFFIRSDKKVVNKEQVEDNINDSKALMRLLFKANAFKENLKATA